MGEASSASGPRPRLVLAGGALAANVLQLAGVYWDVATHHIGARESFWSPPHLAIYAGVGLALLAAAAGLASGRGSNGESVRPFWRGRYGLAALGPAVQVLAGPIDELWHRLIGQDVSIWSPPHLLGILGGMLGLLGWIAALGPGFDRDRVDRVGRGLVFGFAVLLLSGALFALGEYDHAQAVREPWLYPALVGLLAPWILVGTWAWLRWAWAGTAVAVGYTVVRTAVAAAVWGAGLPWMGLPPLIVPAAILLDVLGKRRGAGHAGVAFGLAFTVADYPLTLVLSGRAWEPLEWAGTLLVAAAAGWASGRLGRFLAEAPRPRP